MSRVIAQWHTGTIIVLSSPQTRSELHSVLNRPNIRRLSNVPLDRFAQGLEYFSEQVPGELSVDGACRDPKDDKFLACAVEGDAHYIVSSDNDLLDMRFYNHVAIVNPGQFLVASELYSMDTDDMKRHYDQNVLKDIYTTIPLEPSTKRRVAQALSQPD